MRIDARAKVNLRLVVLARDSGGFHQIETIFCRLALADEIVIEPTAARGVGLDVTGGDAGPAVDNLVTRAAHAYCAAAAIEPAFSITLTKRIPAGAGLGGGSSDAAATLRALDAMHGTCLGTERMLELAGALGSDVPFFVADAPLALAWGRGHRLLAHPGPGSAPALVVMPPVHVSTAAAYARLDVQTDYIAPAGHIDADALGSWTRLAALATNDFQRVVLPDIPGLAAALQCMRSHGALIAQLTGSGAAVFGIFASESARDDAARSVAETTDTMRMYSTAAAV